MPDIVALLQSLAPIVNTTTMRQMSRVITAMLSMTGRVTMLNISRWAEKGGSYRTVQRLFHTVLPWTSMFWLFFQHHLHNPDDVYLLAGDETVVTKAGKKTHGVDRFFSGLQGRPVAGLAFFALSLVSVKERRSYPIMIEQIVKTTEQPADTQTEKETEAQNPPAKRKPGRPKGSKNKDKTEVALTPQLLLIQGMLRKLLELVAPTLPVSYLLLDGQFGHNNALQMTRQCGLHLISKLRRDSALIFCYAGPQKSKGPRRIYGDKIDYQNLPNDHLKQRTTEDGMETRIYQMPMLHREFAGLLNVVIIVKLNLKTQARSHVILFSSDLNLPFDTLIDYYALRFQIEFNFRDAKQYWGMEDFMTVKETSVTNAASLSLFMVNVSHVLLRHFRSLNPEAGVFDLKAHYHGCRYVSETLKLLPETPDPILLQHLFDSVAQLGCIHAPDSYASPP